MACPGDRVHRQGQGACIPYEFGVKASLTSTNKRCKGGQFILHSPKRCPANPYDGHTLKDVIEEAEAMTGRAIERAYVDAGYRSATMCRSQPGSFARDKSAASTARSRRNSARRSPSKPSSAIAKPTAISDRNFLKGRLRRPDQRRQERRRLQPAPHPQVVEATIAPDYRRNPDAALIPLSALKPAS